VRERMSNARRQSVQVQIQEQRELLVVGPDDGAASGTAATGMQELEDLIGAELADAIPKVAVEKLLADIELTAGEALDATKVEPLIVQAAAETVRVMAVPTSEGGHAAEIRQALAAAPDGWISLTQIDQLPGHLAERLKGLGLVERALEEGKKIVKKELEDMVARVVAEVNKKDGSATMSTTLRESIGTMKVQKQAMAVAGAKGIQTLQTKRHRCCDCRASHNTTGTAAA
jgi:hypothetical protein